MSPAERSAASHPFDRGRARHRHARGWNADESLRQAPPQYADAVRLAVVHHTAGSNAYTPAQAPAVVRAIELYHVKGNGWNDIGYNFLIDRFGTVYEGRYGGVDRNVVGAHALGFNHGSVGVAVIGTYVDTQPPARDRRLARLLAWRLDLAHVDPLSTLTSSPEAASATRPAHRWSCGPCRGIAIRGSRSARVARSTRSWTRSPPRPSRSACRRSTRRSCRAIGGEVRLPGDGLARAWTATVATRPAPPSAARPVRAAVIDWTWDSTAVPRRATPGRSPSPARHLRVGARAVAAVATKLALTAVTADPQTISPNGDGEADAATITYTTTAPATVTLTVVDGSGQDTGVLSGPTVEAAGTHTATFRGRARRRRLRDPYRRSRRRGNGVATVAVLVTRTLALPASPRRRSLRTARPRRPALGAVHAARSCGGAGSRASRRDVGGELFSGDLAAGPHVVRWDGSKASGGCSTASTRPRSMRPTPSRRVRLPSVRRGHPRPGASTLAGGGAPDLGHEPAVLKVRVNGSSRSVSALRAGVVRVPAAGRAARVRVVAWDAAGNVAGPSCRA